MIQKTLIIIGVLFILVGLLYPFIRDIGLGRLPGDIVIKENSSFYFPIVTCIVISVVISLILMLFKK